MTNGVFSEQPPVDPAETPALDPTIDARIQAKDSFIQQLEAENAEMRVSLQAKEVEVEAQRLLREAQAKIANPPPSREATPAAQEPAKPLDEDELVERVIKAQEQRTASARAEANAQEVGDHLISVYGSLEAAQKVVADRAAALGVGTAFLLGTAKTSPKAFYELMQLQTAPKQDRAPQGDINPAALKTHAPGIKPGTPEYYENLRKEIGDTAFYTPKIQQQRFKDMQALAAAR